MSLTTKQKGNLTELQCLTAFTENGCPVSIPYGDSDKYDFIADVDGKLLKVQVKTSSLKQGNKDAIAFSCRSTHKNFGGTTNRKYTKEDIDYFATYWNHTCYLIPIEECSTEKTLRFVPPKNGQTKGITFAESYELTKQLEKIRHGGSN